MTRPRLRPRPPPPVAKRPWRQGLGSRSFRQGHAAEWIAAALLMAKGYQILGFRLKTPEGEIDILARRGRILAVVEVKRRPDLETARLALRPEQQARLLRAGRTVLRQRPALKGLRLRIDMVTLAPGRFPRHLRGRGEV